MNGVTCGKRFLNVALGRGEQGGDEGEEVEIIGAVTVGGVLIEGHKRRGVEEQVGVEVEAVDLFAVGEQEGFDVATMAAEGDIVTVGVGEGGGAFHVEGNVGLREVAAKSEFHRHTRHNAPQTAVGRTVRAAEGMREGAHRVGDSAFDQVAGEWQAEEVVGS